MDATHLSFLQISYMFMLITIWQFIQFLQLIGLYLISLNQMEFILKQAELRRAKFKICSTIFCRSELEVSFVELSKMPIYIDYQCITASNFPQRACYPISAGIVN